MHEFALKAIVRHSRLCKAPGAFRERPSLGVRVNSPAGTFGFRRGRPTSERQRGVVADGLGGCALRVAYSARGGDAGPLSPTPPLGWNGEGEGKGRKGNRWLVCFVVLRGCVRNREGTLPTPCPLHERVTRLPSASGPLTESPTNAALAAHGFDGCLAMRFCLT